MQIGLLDVPPAIKQMYLEQIPFIDIIFWYWSKSFYCYDVWYSDVSVQIVSCSGPKKIG